MKSKISRVAEKGTIQHNSKYTELAGEVACKTLCGLSGCKHEVIALQK